MSAVASLLRTYAATKALSEGRRLHSSLKLHGGDRDTVVGNLLVNMYAQCGCLDQARLAFDRIVNRNVFSWNIIVAANANAGHLDGAYDVFDRMPERNVVSWNAMIRALLRGNDLDQAGQLFNQMPEKDNVSWNTMLAAYARTGHIQKAAEIFARIENCDVFSLNTIIAAYSQHGQASKGLELLLLGGGSVKRDFISWNTVLSGFIKERKLDQAAELFQKIPQMDILAWREMLQLFSLHARIEEAKALFDEIPQRDVVSWTAMLQAFATNRYLLFASEVFDRMPEHDDFSSTVMLSGYSDHGHLDRAEKIFASIQSVRDPVAWTAMIHAYARSGHHKQALVLFVAMDLEGIHIDSVSFLAAMDACASIPSLDRGRIIHEEILAQGFDSDVSVRTAILDMYAKCGSLAMAKEIFFGRSFHRDVVSWNALLAAHTANAASGKLLRLFELMLLDGISPTDSSFVAALGACSHAWLIEVAQRYFVSIVSDFEGIDHSLELYMIVIDVLARAGRLEHAEELFHAMPFEPDAVSWRSVAAGCRIHGETVRVLLEQEYDHSSSYLLFTNICPAG